MIAGLILAGGENRRMEGRKKLFLEYRGRPFYRHLSDALSGLEEVWLSVETPEPYRHLGLPLTEDRFPGTGPLGGIGSGLLCCPGKALFVVSCDTPFLTRQTVERIAARYRQTGKPVFARTGRGLQPLCGIYPPEVLPLVETQLAAGEYRLMALLDRLETESLPVAEEELVNINTPADYAAWVEQGQ